MAMPTGRMLWSLYDKSALSTPAIPKTCVCEGCGRYEPVMQGVQKAASDKPQSGTRVASTPTQNSKEFTYNSTKPLDGIIAQLSRECNGNLDLVVEVTASSTKRSRYGP